MSARHRWAVEAPGGRGGMAAWAARPGGSNSVRHGVNASVRSGPSADASVIDTRAVWEPVPWRGTAILRAHLCTSSPLFFRQLIILMEVSMSENSPNARPEQGPRRVVHDCPPSCVVSASVGRAQPIGPCVIGLARGWSAMGLNVPIMIWLKRSSSPHGIPMNPTVD